MSDAPGGSRPGTDPGSGSQAREDANPRLVFEVLTLFPEAVRGFTTAGLLGKAIDKGLVSIECTNFRDFAVDKHRTVDDTPFGGGAGMVIKPEPVVEAIESVESLRGPMHKILLTPSAPRFDQAAAHRLAKHPRIALLCGRYEGIDDRVREYFVDECLSIGDFILGGGEVAALVIIEAVSRLVEGVLGNPDSLVKESFEAAAAGARDRLEYPQYTRPAEFRGHAIPSVLLGGNHAAIHKWREDAARARTWALRPDLRPSVSLPESTPLHVAVSADAPVDEALLEVCRAHDVAGLIALGGDVEASMAWVKASAGRPPVASFASLKQLRRRLRQRTSTEPWVVAILDAAATHPGAIHDAGLLLHALEVGAAPRGRVLVLWCPGPRAVASLAGSSNARAVGVDAVYAQTSNLDPAGEGEVGSGAQTHRAPLETGSGIADSSRPPATLADMAGRALRDLRNAGRPA